MAQNVKSVCDVLIANAKSVCDVLNANVKTLVGVDNTAGGGASAFTLVQVKTASNDGGTTTAVTMDSPIAAGNLVVIGVKWETTGSVTGVTVNGGATTLGTIKSQSGTALNQNAAYTLAASSGTGVAISWTGAADWSRAIVMEFDYGGTATFSIGDSAGADTNPAVDPVIATAAVTNTGTHRLNVAIAGLFTGTVPTTPLIGGAAGFGGTPGTGTAGLISVSDTHAFWNIEQLAAETAQASYAVDGEWTLRLLCFAAN